MNIEKSIADIIRKPLALHGFLSIYHMTINDIMSAEYDINTIVRNAHYTPIFLVKEDTSAETINKRIESFSDGTKYVIIFISSLGIGSDQRMVNLIRTIKRKTNIIIIYATTNNEIIPSLVGIVQRIPISSEMSHMNADILLNIIKDNEDQEIQNIVSILEEIMSPSKVSKLLIECHFNIISQQVYNPDEYTYALDTPEQIAQYKNLLNKERLNAINGIPTMTVEPEIDEKEVVGLTELKNWLKLRFSYPLKGRYPKGILIIGVPGTGKSMLVKAAGNILHKTVIRYNPSAVFNRLLGSSEENIRRDLNIIDKLDNVIVFIDELEKQLAGYGSSNDSDGGTSARVIGNIISWTQDRKSNAFIMATANSFKGIPAELLRSERFDEIFFIDLPQKEERKELFSLYIQKYIEKRRLTNTQLIELAEATNKFNGSDIKTLVVDAYYRQIMEPKKGLFTILMEATKQYLPFAVKFPERMNELYSQKQMFKTVNSQ